MRRELSEETGIAWSDVTVIDVCGEWLGYELPVAVRSAKTGQSQVHRWFLLRWERTEDMRVLDRTVEFDRWQWMPLADLVSATWPPRQPVYRRLAHLWADHIAT